MNQTFSVQYDGPALSDLDDIPDKERKQILKKIKTIQQNPHQAGGVSKLKGYDNLYRLRSGDYRIVFAIENELILIIILAVGHRKDVYDILNRRID